jgi:UDP-N-acetylglucosamine acyltransferase
MNTIHPSAVLHGKVEIGSGNVIGPCATIQGPVIIGDDNYIGPGVSIGSISRERLEPSHRLADPLPPEVSAVIIGNSTMIFDHAVISKPMFEETRIGDHIEIGAQTSIGHDCVIRDHAILSPHVALGAYVTIGASANLGLASAVHNRLTVGGLAICGMGSVIVGHVPAGALVYGNPARIHGPNTVGLTRAGFLKSDIEAVLASLNGSVVELGDGLRQLVEQYLVDLQRWPTNKKEVRWETRKLSSSRGCDPSM